MPLFAEAAGGHHKCVLLLLINGADLGIKDREGTRAVEIAAKAALKKLVALEAAQPGSMARAKDRRLQRTAPDKLHTLDMYSPEDKVVCPVRVFFWKAVQLLLAAPLNPLPLKTITVRHSRSHPDLPLPLVPVLICSLRSDHVHPIPMSLYSTTWRNRNQHFKSEASTRVPIF